MMSPRWLLLYPGCALLAVGLLAGLRLSMGPLQISGVGFDIHTLLYAAGAGILGLQLILFSVITRAIGSVKGVLPPTQGFTALISFFSLERGIILGLAVLGAGLAAGVYSVQVWVGTHLSSLDPQSVMRIAIPSVTLMVAGAEIVFASFILSFIDAQHDSAINGNTSRRA